MDVQKLTFSQLLQRKTRRAAPATSDMCTAFYPFSPLSLLTNKLLWALHIFVKDYHFRGFHGTFCLFSTSVHIEKQNQLICLLCSWGCFQFIHKKHLHTVMNDFFGFRLEWPLEELHFLPVLYWCQFFKPRVRHPSFSFMIRSHLLICGHVLSSVTNSLGIKGDL